MVITIVLRAARLILNAVTGSKQKTQTPKKMWYLQKNEQGSQFWDDYIHPECVVLAHCVDSPIKSKK